MIINAILAPLNQWLFGGISSAYRLLVTRGSNVHFFGPFNFNGSPPRKYQQEYGIFGWGGIVFGNCNSKKKLKVYLRHLLVLLIKFF